MAENLELLQSSFTENDLPMNIKPANNGFILGCVRAYNNHCHLKIRPEDVWFAILTQFVAFINAHAEDLRERFVAHEGQIMLEITSEGTRHSKVHDKFATEMAKLLDSNVVDPELRQWIMPNFSTTTKNDTVVASILMMASLQSYFKYQENFKCGFPSVTILGEKKDWELVLEKISKLETFGDEPLHFGTLLRPIISRFIRSFDDPTGPEIIDFWQRMFFRGPNGSGGQTKFSGWISAFCFWDQQGICMYAPATESHRFHDPRSGTVVQPECLQLDGISYGRANLGKIPQGWSKVPVTINDHGVEYQAQMFAVSEARQAKLLNFLTHVLKHCNRSFWSFENYATCTIFP